MYWDGKVTILCNNSGQKMDGIEHVTVLAGFSQRSGLSSIHCWQKSPSTSCWDRPCSATLLGYTSDSFKWDGKINSFLPQKSCLYVPSKLLACEQRCISGYHLSLSKNNGEYKLQLEMSVFAGYQTLWKPWTLFSWQLCGNPVRNNTRTVNLYWFVAPQMQTLQKMNQILHILW